MQREMAAYRVWLTVRLDFIVAQEWERQGPINQPVAALIRAVSEEHGYHTYRVRQSPLPPIPLLTYLEIRSLEVVLVRQVWAQQTELVRTVVETQNDLCFKRLRNRHNIF